MSYSADAAIMRAIDGYTINEIGVPGAVLMERAALALAEQTEKLSGKNPARKMTVSVVYGRGNNGGDGLAAARILKLRGYEVCAIPAAGGITPETMSEDEKRQYDSAVKCGVEIKEYGSLQRESAKYGTDLVIIDAIFGIGLVREVEGDYAETVESINKAHEAGAKVISVDIPSGISADTGMVLGTAVRADITVSFGFMKHGLLLYPGAYHAGKVCVADAGFAVTDGNFTGFAGDVIRKAPEGNVRFATYFASGDEVRLPERFAWSNKGSYGKLLIIGGNKSCAGAGYLAAHAAFMSGCGMVKVLTCADTVALLNAKQPEAMTGVLFTEDGGFDEEVLKAGLAWADVILIGPGLGRSKAPEEVLKQVMKAGKRLTVDADALNIIAGELAGDRHAENDDHSGGPADGDSAEKNAYDKRAEKIAALLTAPAVFTPHIGELARLTGKNADQLKRGIFEIASEYAGNSLLTFVCKDARTVIASKGRLHVNINGNSGMSTAGAGDVLAGLVAGLLSAGLEPYEAARTGVYIHAMAGDAAAERMCEDCITAGDISNAIAECISKLRKPEK